MTREIDDKLLDLLVITSEECGELTQACSKILRKYNNFHEIDDKSRAKLLEEVGDVYCMIELLQIYGLVDNWNLMARVSEKRKKLKTWSKLIP